MKTQKLIAIAAGLVVIGNAPAFAGDQDDVDMCMTAIEDAALGESKDVRFRSIKGSARKRISFEVESANGEGLIQCDVRRGKVMDLAWVDDAGTRTALNQAN